MMVAARLTLRAAAFTTYYIFLAAAFAMIMIMAMLKIIEVLVWLGY